MLSEEDMLQRATVAFHRHCRNHGCSPVQPCSARSEVDGSRVTLRNVNGTLAQYELRGNRLVMLDLEDDTDELSAAV